MYFTLAIPFVTAATVLNLYKAVPIPMPNDGTEGHASQYFIESDFIAVSSTQKIALLSQDEINRCVGSSSFSVCINGFSRNSSGYMSRITIDQQSPNCSTKMQKNRKDATERKSEKFGKWKVVDNISTIEFQNVHKPNNKP